LKKKLYSGALIRSKCENINSNENVSNYFHNCEASKGHDKLVYKIINPDGSLSSSTECIMNSFSTFYKHLYSDEHVDSSLNHVFRQSAICLPRG